jgi:streptomycin 6-kinase
VNALPDAFVKTVTETFEGGAEWLEGLSARIARCEERWSLKALPPFPALSYNYVAPAILGDGTEAVLKLGAPNPELHTEMKALQIYDGRGMIRLIDADGDLGAMVLERLRPGAMLSTLDDDAQATSLAAQVMRQLWRPAPVDQGFPTVAKWASGLGELREHFNGGTGPFPSALVEMAERLFEELLGSMQESVLLHGDLHHYNILSAERQPWLAIDPKGVLGEPAYEIGAFLRNEAMDRPDPLGLTRRRADQFASELGLDRERILAWSMAQAVLAAWWGYDDHGEAPALPEWIACAELMAQLLRD